MGKKGMFALYRMLHLEPARLHCDIKERLLLGLVFGGLHVGNETLVDQYIFMRALPCSGKMNETKYILDFAVQAGRF